MLSIAQNVSSPLAWFLAIVPTLLVTALTLAIVAVMGQLFRFQAVARLWQRFPSLPILLVVIGLALICFTEKLGFSRYYWDFHNQKTISEPHPAVHALGYLMISFVSVFWPKKSAIAIHR